MSLYIDQVKDIVRNGKAPWAGLIIDVMESHDYPGLLLLMCHRDNYESFSTRQQQDLSVYVVSLRDKIKKIGIQCEIGMT